MGATQADEEGDHMTLPDDVRELLDGPNFVHLSTLRRDGSPRNWVVWVGLEGDLILVCTSSSQLKAQDMSRDPRVALSLTDMADPYRMAVLQGRVVEVRRDDDSGYMDPISVKYTGKPFPFRGEGRVCFVIEADRATMRKLPFEHTPAAR
jgi:PPOX class probable F420-dependent enzyme